MKTDSQLQRDVMKELEWEPRIDAAHVPSCWEKYEAVRAATN